eukprot:scaffold7697_cov264-Chaetoceros_neogracile.AAC.21
MISTADEGRDCALLLIVVNTNAYYFLVVNSEQEMTNSFEKTHSKTKKLLFGGLSVAVSANEEEPFLFIVISDKTL